MRGALSLAKLNQSTGWPAEARAVLAPALKGFSPTLEMPEIARTLALMERLASGRSRRSPSNGGFGADSGPSRVDSCTPLSARGGRGNPSIIRPVWRSLATSPIGDKWAQFG